MGRRSNLDKGSVTAGLVNTAYSFIKTVADNIVDVIKVAANISTLSSYDALPTADGGDGSINGDMDAMDWTGHEYADDSIQTALLVSETQNLIISHKGIIYTYTGTKPILLGVGGTATLISDYSTLASGDHAALTGLDTIDQHTIGATIGLQTALDSKATPANISAHTNLVNNPHAVTKTQVGLANVDDTSDVSKPVSTATQTELNKAVRFNDGANGLLANVATRALKFLGFDAAGNIIYSAGTTNVSANAVPIDDAANYYTATEVEAALAEVVTKATTAAALLASTTTGEGAALIGSNDTGLHFTGTNLEAITQEIGASLAVIPPTLKIRTTDSVDISWLTLINWAAPTEDTESAWNATTNEYVIPSDGRYIISVNLNMGNPSNAATEARTILIINSVSVLEASKSARGSTVYPIGTLPLTASLSLTTGDIVKIYGHSDVGTIAMNVSPHRTWLTIVKVGN